MSNQRAVDPHPAAPAEAASERRGLLPLLIVNVMLLAAVAFVTFGAPAIAQYRAPGSYHGVSITAPGAQSGVVIVVDETNQAMIGLVFNPNTAKFEPAGKRDLAQDAIAVLRGRQ